MRYSDEAYQEIRIKIRQYLQIHPNAMATQIAELLKIPYKVAWAQTRKVRKQIIEQLRNTTSDKDLADYSEFLILASPEIKSIIFDKDKEGDFVHPAKTRILAFTAMVKGQERVLNLKMDLGLYKRNLGKIDVAPSLTPTQQKILDKALLYATKRANTSRPERDSGEQAT